MAVREQRPAFPHVNRLMEREVERFRAEHPRSLELAERAKASLLGGVPMHWMVRWAGGFPVFAQEAHGSRLVDVDGIEYVDFCLGDTGAMTGHSPEPVVRAISEQAGRGITLMLPSEDAIWVGNELQRRFGLRFWQFALTATDANRFAIRIARAVTGRPKILVFNWCYHGTVDETVVTLVDGEVRPREGSVGPPVDPTETTRVAEFNDLEGLERELAHGDVACVLAEPALTNIGIVLPVPGFHDALRELTRRYGTLLVIDETHTICAGPRRLHRGIRSRARPPDDREADRERDPRSRLRAQRGCCSHTSGRHPRGALGCRRARRNARRERALAHRDAGDAVRGSDRRGLHSHDRDGRALRRRRCRCDRRPWPSLARCAPWLPRGVPFPSWTGSNWRRGRRRG